MAKTPQEARPQVAALPIRWKDGKLRVLLITSRTTRRWIIPKGWPMTDLSFPEAAAIEAQEEAGVVGQVLTTPLGHYHYRKVLSETACCLCKVTVYPLIVDRLEECWKEQDERTRRWVSAKEAVAHVQEPELAAILRVLGKQCRSRADLEALGPPS